MEPEEHYEDDFEDATDEEAGHEHAGADAGADTTGVAWQDVNVAELELGEQIGGGGFSLVHRVSARQCVAAQCMGSAESRRRRGGIASTWPSRCCLTPKSTTR